MKKRLRYLSLDYRYKGKKLKAYSMGTERKRYDWSVPDVSENFRIEFGENMGGFVVVYLKGAFKERYEEKYKRWNREIGKNS